ncbi:MAG: hypothetical protein IPM70_00690 [Proteobacteria bacterium]|nr:hypothetical protein [Pseudomonadota bacterium]
MTIRSSLIAALVGVTLLLPTAHGAAAPDRKPDIFGVWLAIASNSTNFDPRWANKPYAPTPSSRPGVPSSHGSWDGWASNCPRPAPANRSTRRASSAAFPTQILQGHNQIVILNEWVAVPRRIYMDGRDHPAPEDTLPTWQGHSIGRWEGDTLVVDTVGTNGRSRPINGYLAGNVNATPESLKVPRLPASDQMRLVERFRLLGNGNILEVTKTITDPKAYLRPFSNTVYMERRNDIDVQEYYCADNERTKDEGH